MRRTMLRMQMRKRFGFGSVLVALLASQLLTACGGGSGNTEGSRNTGESLEDPVIPLCARGS